MRDKLEVKPQGKIIKSTIFKIFYNYFYKIIFRMLEEACNICLDSTRDELNVWENVYINFTNKKTLGYFFKMKEWPLIGGICKGYITAHLAFIYEVSTTFVICVKEALEI